MCKRTFVIALAALLALTVKLPRAGSIANAVSAPETAGPSAPGPSADAVPTFTRDIAPILFQNCAGCHHPGEVAPFSLLTFADARKHSTELAELTLSRQMPPWKPLHGYGDFAGERRLTDEQIDVIQRWVKGGRLEGDGADLPPAPTFAAGWVLGEPDLTVKMPKEYTLRAEGNDVLRSFVIPLNLPEDKYVEAVEFHPSNRKIVHHALLFLDSSGKAKELDGADGSPGFGRGAGGLGFVPSGGLGGWAPGVTPVRLPQGVARFIRKGSDLVVQIHFHSDGKAETEQPTIGLYFAKAIPQKIFIGHMRGGSPKKLNIAPGDSNYEINETFTVPADIQLQGVFPHAHLVCKEIEVNATLPDGKEIPIIWIKDWDWDWQDQYLYKHALDIPRGTQVHMRFRFDNSQANPKNPNNPPKRVRWGEQTSDEMALVFFNILVDRSAAEQFRSKARLQRVLDALKNRAE